MKEEHYKELGLFIVNFQNLEKEIAFFASELISQDQTLGNIMISKMSFRNLCDTFASLFYYRCKNAKLNKDLEKVLNRIIKINEKKFIRTLNMGIHSF